MKNLIFTLALALVPLFSFAQNFPGEKVELLQGKQLKVLPKETSLQKYGYRNFFTDASLKKVYRKKETGTAYEALENKVFDFVDAIPYENSIGAQKFKLILDNKETGTLYYDYDPRFSSSYPFEVIGGLTYPDGFFCDQVVEKKLPSGKIYFEFPFADGVQAFSLTKNAPTVFFKINLPTNEKIAEDVVVRGVILTFENGQTYELPEQELSHTPNEAGGTVLTAVFAVKGEENLKNFKGSKLTKIKLNKFERNFEEGMTLQEYVKCIIQD